MTSANPLLTLENVSRAFDGGTIVALDDVSLRVERHELTAIHGPSGSGKSTLLGIMSGLDTPTSGQVTFEGCRSPMPGQWASLRASTIGIVFQDFNLLPTLTAAENVQVAMFAALPNAAKRRQASMERLAEVGIAHCADRFPPQLSGGERQRVSVARSLANNPQLLLADEPTSNLDTKAGAAVVDLLLDVQKARGIAMLIVTHDRSVIERCPHRIQMSDGRIIDDSRC